MRQRNAHIFLLSAVMSRDAFMMRSRRSWCESSSSRKVSNMGMKGEIVEVWVMPLGSDVDFPLAMVNLIGSSSAAEARELE